MGFYGRSWNVYDEYSAENVYGLYYCKGVQNHVLSYYK